MVYDSGLFTPYIPACFRAQFTWRPRRERAVERWVSGALCQLDETFDLVLGVRVQIDENGGQEYSFRGLVAVEGRGAARALVREVDGLEGWRVGGAGGGGWLQV